MKKIDAKGLACPKPVIETKKYLDNNPDTETLVVMVDNQPAKENVTRFMESKGMKVSSREDNGIFELTGTMGDGEFIPEEEKENSSGDEIKTLVMIANDKLGFGDEVLGGKLMHNFIATLEEYSGLWKLVFVNAGVKFAVKGSSCLDSLKKLEKNGVKILVCGTCLDHYGLLDDKEIGETTNMLDIMTSLEVAEKVINL